MGFRTIRAAGLCICVIAVIAGSSAPAHAATIVVPPGGNIQAAVDAASPGDTVKLSKGVYNQSVSIGATKTGLKLVASCDPTKRSTIDGLIAGTNETGVEVLADNVLIKCITFRHTGHGIEVPAGSAPDTQGIKIVNVRVLNAKGDSVRLDDVDNIRIDGLYSAGSHSNGVETNRVDGGSIVNSVIKNNDSDCMSLHDTTGLKISKNRSSICEDGDHIEFQNGASDNTITNNVWDTSDGACVFLFNAVNTRIANNRCTNVEDSGIMANTSTDTVVEANVLRSIDTSCCNAAIRGTSAPRMTVRGNKVTSSYRAVEIFGDEAVVENNRSVDSGAGAYRINGEMPIVLNNRASNAGDDDGFNVTCSGDCAGGRVEGNSTQGTNSDDEGFFLSVAWDQVDNSANAGFRIVGNTSKANTDEGFNIFASETVIEANTATGNGGDSSEDGFFISGGGNTIRNNVSLDNVDDGFEIFGWNNVISGNRAEGNLADGFHIVDTFSVPETHVLDANKAVNNQGEGIENDATGTELTNNVSKGNRTDCAGDKDAAVDTNNTCADGSVFTDPGRVDGEVD